MQINILSMKERILRTINDKDKRNNFLIKAGIGLVIIVFAGLGFVKRNKSSNGESSDSDSSNDLYTADWRW